MIRPPTNRPAPATLASRALAFIASDPDRLGKFLALSGLDPSSIREASRSLGFLPAVLDHVLSDERLVIEFASYAGVPPESVADARARLNCDEPEE